MSTRTPDPDRVALLQGTLDLLILRTLLFGPQHGQGIARAIEQQAEDALLVDHGSLYPALQRLEARGWIAAEWGTSDNNRKARFYTLSKAGRKQLTAQTRQWRRLTAAIGRVLGPERSVSHVVDQATHRRGLLTRDRRAPRRSKPTAWSTTG